MTPAARCAFAAAPLRFSTHAYAPASDVATWHRWYGDAGSAYRQAHGERRVCAVAAPRGSRCRAPFLSSIFVRGLLNSVATFLYACADTSAAARTLLFSAGTAR